MTTTLPLAATNTFSKTFLDYISGDSNLEDFYGLKPTLDNFQKQIELKNFSISKRETLYNTLQMQYDGVNSSEETKNNITSLLLPTTYTITTGHQLNLFGGPLYFIYKIITTLNTAKELNKKYPAYNFVPVFWMASEDHDFEEINNFNLFGKTWKWDTIQKGAVGRFSTDGISELLDSLPEKIELFEKAYLQHKTISAATRYFVNELFGKDGLVLLDADDRNLKNAFSEIIKDDIINHSAHSLVQKTSLLLEEKGYEAQVHAREINFFYLENNLRERIILQDGLYKINNTSLSFSKEEIITKIQNEPEKFSPNVILRPLYQETILPNLAYIGGPAEVIYWLQFKAVFDHYKTPFPIVMPRNFALYLNKGNISKLSKLEVQIEDFFVSEEQLKNNYLLKIAGEEFKLNKEQEEIKKIFFNIKEKATLIDKTMEAAVMAELHKSIKIIEELEKRLKKAEERKNEIVITQLLTQKSKLFPNGGLQERHDNYLSIYTNNPQFLEIVKKAFDPFNYQFYVLREDE